MKRKRLFGRIVVDPKVMVGKPVIKGTRLTVQHRLGLLAQGMTIEDIVDEHKNLTREDIFACLMFARDMLADSTFVSLST